MREERDLMPELPSFAEVRRNLEFRKKLHEESEERRKDSMIDDSFFRHKSNQIAVQRSLTKELNDNPQASIQDKLELVEARNHLVENMLGK